MMATGRSLKHEMPVYSDDFDDDFDDIEDDIFEQEPTNDLSNFQNPRVFEESSVLAQHAVEEYFADKFLCSGGRVPKMFLRNERKIDMVINCSICAAVDLAHESLKGWVTKESTAEATRQGTYDKDVEMVSSLLQDLAERRVSKQYSGGLLLMVLEYCYGVRVDWTRLEGYGA